MLARALVLQLLLAGVAALPTLLTSKADGAIPGHLRGPADASDHATFHSRYLRRIDEEVADAHDQHALTPPDGNGVHHVHRSARGQNLLFGVDAAHVRARRASSRAELGQTPRHPHLERRGCPHITINSADTLKEAGRCGQIDTLEVRVSPRPPSPALG